MAIIYVATTGNDTTGDGSEGNPYATPGKAMDMTVAGGTVRIKEGTYTTQHGTTSSILCANVTASIGSPIKIEGYSTTPGDGGIATFDANFTYQYCVTFSGAGNHYVFEGIKAINARSNGWNLNGPDQITFVRCEAHDCWNWGWNVDNYCKFISCTAVDNISGGIDSDQMNAFFGCFLSGGAYGISTQLGSTVWGCVIHSFSTTGVSAGNGPLSVIGCVIDGCGGASANGIYGSNSGMTALNNIVRGCNIGLTSADATDPYCFEDYNCLYDCTTPRTNWATGPNTITSDPKHVDAANHDYSLDTGSPCIEAGVGPGGKHNIGPYNGPDMGGTAETAGLLIHPGMAGGMRG